MADGKYILIEYFRLLLLQLLQTEPDWTEKKIDKYLP